MHENDYGNKDVMTVMGVIDNHFPRDTPVSPIHPSCSEQVTTGRVVSPGSSRMQIDAESIPSCREFLIRFPCRARCRRYSTSSIVLAKDYSEHYVEPGIIIRIIICK